MDYATIQFDRQQMVERVGNPLDLRDNPIHVNIALHTGPTSANWGLTDYQRSFPAPQPPKKFYRHGWQS
jgi:hypothetical protein